MICDVIRGHAVYMMKTMLNSLFRMLAYFSSELGVSQVKTLIMC